VKDRDCNPAAQWVSELYDRGAPAMLLYGKALGLGHGEAEDVLQDTFAALLRLPQRPKRPRHYALRAYRYRALNFRRGFWRRLTREWESRQWFEKGTANLVAEQEALRCLAELPAEQKEVIVLKIWHKLTFREIGRLIGVSPHTAAGRYRYGLEKMRKHFNPQEDDEPRRNGTVPQWMQAVSPISPDSDSALRIQ